MYCKHCGSPLSDNAMFCHNCGAAITDRQPQQPQQYIYQSQQPPLYQSAPAHTNGGNALAIVGLVLAFFFPLVGLICSILGYSKAKKGAPYGELALAGIIISAVLMVLYIILFITLYNLFYKLFYYFFYSIFKAFS